jgi:glycosyltransferase involved in cell wall biosynthesis
MKILYFSYQYYNLNGSRTHARSFYDALTKNERVSGTALFPVAGDSLGNATDNREQSFQPDRFRALLHYAAREVWRNCLPDWGRIQLSLLFPSPIVYRSLSALIRKEQSDAVVIRTGGMFRFLQRLRRDFPNIKICVEFNATGFDEFKTWIPKRELWRHEEARQFGFADCICVVSEYLRRYLLSLNPALDHHIILNPNGVDPDLFKPQHEKQRARSRREMNIPDSAVVFGYVGGMESFRRLPEVVRRMADLRRHGLDRLFLVIIGTGEDGENVANAISESSNGLPAWIFSSNGWVEHERIPNLVAAFDVGIFPYSNPYGAPQKILEYMACGLPIIGPDVPAVTEQFTREYLPFLVRQDGSNFEQIVHHLYDSHRLYTSVALKARELVKREFTWVANAERVVNAIHSVAN